MQKNNDQDFAKTVVIPPEENEAFRQKTMATTKRVTNQEAMGGTVKGPPKGLSGWSVFFLLVVAVLVGFGVVLMYLQ